MRRPIHLAGKRPGAVRGRALSGGRALPLTPAARGSTVRTPSLVSCLARLAAETVRRKKANVSRALVLAIIILAAAAVGRADDPPLGPQRGVLLLRNGELIEGDVTLSGDRYDVVVPSGEIHVRRSDVQFVGRTLLDCYDRRKAMVSVDKVHDHLELAEWCLRHRLYDQTALALADAVNTDATHPRIGLLERRLKFELDQQSQATRGKSTQSELPSARDLDRMVQGLPPGAVETFTSTIQPMLLNHCSTAGCHGPQGNASLRLLRVPTGQAPSRRATQRNLYAVLSAIDQNHPGDSPLLSAPTRAHGQAKSAVFTTREALQYRQLLTWVYTVSNQQAPVANATSLGEPRISRSAARRRAAQLAKRDTDPPAESSGSSEPAEPDTVRTGFKHLANQGAGRPKDDATDSKAADAKPANPWAEKTEPAESDAFDPQSFNDRYLKAPGQ
jgi:hypothetical protein